MQRQTLTFLFRACARRISFHALGLICASCAPIVVVKETRPRLALSGTAASRRAAQFRQLPANAGLADYLRVPVMTVSPPQMCGSRVK